MSKALPVACVCFGFFSAFSAPLSAADHIVRFNIPAQPMSDALLEFSESSGTKVFFSSDDARNIRTHGLSGNYTSVEALRHLLAGTDLVAQETGAGTVTVTKSEAPSAAVQPQTATMLKAMTVEGEAVRDPNDPYNADYNRTHASTATKTDTPIMETPMSIQIVPKAVINDQQSIRTGDALRNVSGYFNTNGEEFFYDGAYLRGFQVGSRQYIDGLLDLAQSRSLANLERVEVLKGPAGALYGRLEPGGLINHVSKRPLYEPYYSVQQQLGSFDRYRTQIDATGPITKDETLAYRVNLEYLDSNSFIDYLNPKRLFIAPSLTWKISSRTQLDLDFRYHEIEGTTSQGQPAVGNRPANIPISRFFGEPSTDDEKFSLYYGGLSLVHQFNDNWKVDAKFGYNNQLSHFADTGIDSIDELTGVASRAFYSTDYREESVQGLINVTGKFSTFGIDHTLVFGWDYYNREGEENAYFLCEFCGTATYPAPLNIYNPAYGQPGVNLSLEQPNSPYYITADWYGFYLQDQVTLLDDWHLMFGTRFDQAETVRSLSPNRVDPITVDDSEFSPRVGLLYQPFDWFSVYGNYVQGFNAANMGRVVPGTVNQPERSESYEVGFKGDWWHSRLTSNLTFYELTKSNVSQPATDPDLALQGYSSLSGKARSKGIEFDVAGKLTDSWSLIGTYTFTDTKFVSDNTGNQGNQFANVPRHAGSLWSRYDFSELGGQGFWTGAGVFLAGQRQGDNSNSFQLPGFARVDAALGYSFHAGPTKLSLQFNVDNLLDKKYYASGGFSGSRTGIQPGAPRTFLGSVRVEF